MAWDTDRCDLYTGDALGYIRKWNISDVITDLGGVTMLQAKNTLPKDVFLRTRRKRRDYKSALVPIAEPETTYVLGHKSNGSYLGIEFGWTVYAHEENIIQCKYTKHGLITSSSDKLLKMWTYEGTPIGILMEGVPIGMKNVKWNLELDIESLVDKENKKLQMLMQMLMQVVIKISLDTNLPNIKKIIKLIYTYFYSYVAIDSSVYISHLSTSSLRKRIQHSSRILGLTFQQDMDVGRHIIGNSNDDISVNSLQSLASLKSADSMASAEAIDQANLAHIEDSYIEVEQGMNLDQRKRHERMLNSIIDKYEGKTDLLPSLRKGTNSKKADIRAIEQLSSCMNIEDASLGSQVANNQFDSTIKDNDKNKNLPHVHSFNWNSKASIERVQAVRTLCKKYPSFKNLDTCIDDDSDGIARRRKNHNKDDVLIKNIITNKINQKIKLTERYLSIDTSNHVLSSKLSAGRYSNTKKSTRNKNVSMAKSSILSSSILEENSVYNENNGEEGSPQNTHNEVMMSPNLPIVA
jgi:hypothetical protein